MLNQVLLFLLETFLSLFVLALLLRFYIQLFRAPVRNPLSYFLAALTDWILIPMRRVVPGLWGLDIATVLTAWLIQILLVVSSLWLGSIDLGAMTAMSFVLIAVMSAVQLFKLSVYIVLIAVLIQAVLSWVSPYNPLTPLLNSLTRPFLRLFQRRIPPVGNVDLSPLFVLIVCQVLLMLLAGVERGLT